MRVELFPFQRDALEELRGKLAAAMDGYRRTASPQVISFTAPTGAEKTIIMSALIESIFLGDATFAEQPDAIVVWLSDSPQLNEQSKLKIDGKADKIRLGQCVTITDESFDRDVLEDGHMYFLNTQKLSASSNLTKHGDHRTYTIWETLSETVEKKGDQLYFIIDEAHRGMQGKDASRATTIMQKFLKGSEEDGLTPMPVVIGMSATMERFNRLVENTTSTVHKVMVTPDAVRASGLLKDRIVITYPEEDAANNDMAILQAATDDWREKWDHWTRYCKEQHYAYVNPIFLLQVANGSGKEISETDLSDCLQKIEDRIGMKFSAGQVVHTFGQTYGDVLMGGLSVPYREPSRIAEDKEIRVVFFKENLTTGWDCPRAETMMSFRHARDATYIAQLLGRMVRTPLQMHIKVDDVLNDVHLYLPHFNRETAENVVKELQNSEGGEIPADVYEESLANKKYVRLTARNRRSAAVAKSQDEDRESSLFENSETKAVSSETSGVSSVLAISAENVPSIAGVRTPTAGEMKAAEGSESLPAGETKATRDDVSLVLSASSVSKDSSSEEPKEMSAAKTGETEAAPTLFDFDREAVIRFINTSGFLTYSVQTRRPRPYLQSIFALVHLLSQSGIAPDVLDAVRADVAKQIHSYVEELKAVGRYDAMVEKAKEFKLLSQVYDAFGKSVDRNTVHTLFSTTESDIDRQFDMAEKILESEGLGKYYMKRYLRDDNYTDCKLDVILFVGDEDRLHRLSGWAKERFHQLQDQYRQVVARMNRENIREGYDRIVSNGDTVSCHSFSLPEDVDFSNEPQGKEYKKHLYVSEETGTVRMKLNGWEDGVIEEESEQPDFVCWIRNPTPQASQGGWGLCIPYEIKGETKSTFPDFLVVRKDEYGYVMDILEPHNPNFTDNLPKAKAFAKYAKENPSVGRVQLIREEKDLAGKKRFKRLDMAQSGVQEKILKMMMTDELDHLFDTDGFF